MTDLDPTTARRPLQFTVDDQQVEVPDDGTSLLTVLRERLGLRSAKDGCSPQGQCGCCTVLVDGAPRVACVTPARRVRGRAITTLDGLDPDERRSWAEAFCATGASQCGFCTPGIIVRLSGLAAKGTGPEDVQAVEQALLAHLCRCTGWRTILDAWTVHASTTADTTADITADITTAGAATQVSVDAPAARDLDDAAQRATIEGRSPQLVSPEVALGHGGFADDRVPEDALVAVPDPAGGWAVADTLAEALAEAGKVQGRRTTADLRHPLDLPDGDWSATLRTTWIEPAYLEVDASWCTPGGEPATPLANGGAFGGKVTSPAASAARTLAGELGRPVRVVLAREDAVRLGPKRPPVAGGMRPDGTGVLRVVSTPGVEAAVAAVAPRLVVDQVPTPGPPTSLVLRAAGWAEALVLSAAAGVTVPDGSAAPATAPATGAGPGEAGDVEARGIDAAAGVDAAAAEPGLPGILDVETADGRATVTLRSPDGAVAQAGVNLGPAPHVTPHVTVRVSCGRVLDEVVLRSYCTGAAHMALGWVTTEGLAVDEAGDVHDLTIRSFGVLRAVDTPPITVSVDTTATGTPVNGSDAVFAAVAAATWLAQGCPPDWPTGVSPR